MSLTTGKLRELLAGVDDDIPVIISIINRERLVAIDASDKDGRGEPHGYFQILTEEHPRPTENSLMRGPSRLEYDPRTDRPGAPGDQA